MDRKISSAHPALLRQLQGCPQEGVSAWLQRQARSYQYLLAHARDGVIWGRVNDQVLVLAPKISPPLRDDTLLEARLFGPTGELFVWRSGDGRWHARTILDGTNPHEEPTRLLTESLDELHMLWGTHTHFRNAHFTVLSDGAQGLWHCAPVTFPEKAADAFPEHARPVRLHIRHYLHASDIGAVTIAVSRLMGVTIHIADAKPRYTEAQS